MSNNFFQILRRDAVSIYSEDALREKLNNGKRLIIKLGADPSRPDLHLGHSVVLRKLRMFQDLGHEVVFVIGDFTGMIGDPSGKSKTRSPLTFEQTRINGKTYLEQVTKILDKDKTRIVYNSEWLSEMNFADVLSLAGKYTLARIMERDDFANRFADGRAIGLHELLYPLMQGYDSVALNADIEVGGTDQTFNLLVGRDLQRDYGQEAQVVITFPILVGLDGVEKMSKSLDNYIGLDEPAEVMFEKCMRVPDAVLSDYIRLTTELQNVPDDIRDAHFVYAREIVRMYHGDDAVLPAENRYRSVAGGIIPKTVETVTLPKENCDLVELLCSVGFASSKSEARRLIAGRGIKLNGKTADDPAITIDQNEIIISRGKNRFIKIIFE